MLYDERLTVREAREIYFKNSGFDERNYSDRWIPLPILGIKIYLPNIKSRREAVRIHDINHVLTEYGTDWVGEWKMSAYELGTGCGRYLAAWLINLQAILAGGVREPRACVKAFARGRRSRGAYGAASYESLLSRNLGELRQETTAAENSVAPSTGDAILFYLFFIFSVVIHLAPVALVLMLVSLQ